ncbi:MAG: hypothetical protein HYW27_04015, partial [Candidatus Aenigmarchaeota archaeon]|nr:hypothetical protein [Candidatus Aenigmarchaeota archaeon]
VYDSMRGATLRNEPYEWLIARLENGQSKVYYVVCRKGADEGKLTVRFTVQLPGEGTKCGGTPPAGGNFIRGPWTYTGAGLLWEYSDSATTTTPCRWKCESGYQQSGNECVASSGNVVYSCTGVVSQNAQLCPGDNSGLSANTPITLINSDSCSAAKCEYTCVSGYQRNGNTCVLSAGGGTGGSGTGGTSATAVEAGTISEYSTMSGRVTASGLGLVTMDREVTVSGAAINYSTYIDLTSPQTIYYELTYDNMRAQLSSRQFNFGPLPAAASRNSYFYKTVVEFQTPVAPAEMPGMLLKLFGTDYTVLSAGTSSVSFVDAYTANYVRLTAPSGIANAATVTYEDINYTIENRGIFADRANFVVRTSDDYMTPEGREGLNNVDISPNSFNKFRYYAKELYLGVMSINYVSSSSEQNNVLVLVGKNKSGIAENSETSNSGYFLDIETDSSGRITKIVVYVTKSNEGRNYLIAGEKFTDPFWKSFRLAMEAVSDTQARISVEKVA